MGVKIDEFDIPVCNSFQARILNDQLCYEVDLNRLSNKDNIERELKLGLNFLMDYNEDRQVTINWKNEDKIDTNLCGENTLGLANSFVGSDNNQHALIYLNTIGDTHYTLYAIRKISVNLFFFFRTTFIDWRRRV